MPVERPEIIKVIKSNYLFKKLDDVKIDLVVNSLETLELQAGACVFQEKDPAVKLYIVLRGKVRLSRTLGDVEASMGLLESGDIFGYEMLEYDNECLTSAVAVDQTILLCLDQDHTLTLLEEIKTLNLDLKILYESYKLFLKVKLTWRDPDEAVVYFARQNSMYLFYKFLPIIVFSILTLPILFLVGVWLSGKGLITPALLLAIDSVVILIWSIWTYIDWTNDYAFITSRRAGFIEKVVLLHDSRQEAPLSAVQSVATDTDFWGRTLSYGDVTIRTFAGSFVFPHVAYPKQVAALLGVQRERALKQRVDTEQAELEDVIRVRLGYKPRMARPKAEQKQNADRGGIRLFSKLRGALQLRRETSDTVTWRTHWIMLLKSMSLPLLLIVATVVVLVLRFLNILPFLPLQALMALGALIILVGAGWCWYVFADWSNDIYIVTPDQVLDINHKPLAKEERRAAPLKNVLSVEYQQNGIFALLFNFGTVYIGVGETKLSFDDVPNPTDVQRELFKRLAMRDYREKHTEIEAEQKRVANWIAAYHRVVEEERKAENHAP